MKKLNGQTVSAIKGFYLCALTVYAVLREILAIQNIVSSSLFTYGFCIAGLLIIGACLLIDWRPYLYRNQWLPMVFLLLCVVSVVFNLKHSLISNVKAITWMLLYFLLLLPNGWERETEKRNWDWIMWTAVTTLLLMALVSLPMYFFNVDYSYVRDSGFPNNQGFSRQYMRLWGLYNDANTAGVYSLVGICFAVYLFIKNRGIWVRAYFAFAAVILLLMLILTNSRTAYVTLAAAMAWTFVYFAITRSRDKMLSKRLMLAVLAFVLALGLTVGIYEGGQTVLSHAKAVVQRGTSESIDQRVHTVYDRLFQGSGMNITQGYYAPDDIAEPTEVSDEADNTEPATHPGETENTSSVESLDRTDGKDDVSNGRFQKWGEVLMVVRYKPLFGASPRGIPQAAKAIAPDSTIAKYGFAAHNSFLEVLAGTGVAGMLVVLAILVTLAWRILRAAFLEQFSWEIWLYSTVLLLMVCEMMFLSDVFFTLTFGGIAFWLAAGRIFDIYALPGRRSKA